MSEWRRYLPSKQFIGVATPLLIGFAATLALIYISYPDRGTSAAGLPEDRASLLAVATEALMREQFQNIDSDGDGLYDWEEALWGTDPHNPDTSGDGMLDGEAVRQGRDPLVPGPDNFLWQTRGIGTSTQLNELALSPTEKLSRDFLGSYLQMKQAGQITEENKQRLLSNLLVSTASELRLGEQRSADSFTVIRTVAEPERLAYFNAMDAVYLSMGTPHTDNMLLIYQAVEMSRSEASEEIASNLSRYSQAVETLESMPVPREALAEHIRLTNAIAAYRDVIKALSDSSTDPLISLLALHSYERAVVDVYAASNAMRAYFANIGYISRIDARSFMDEPADPESIPHPSADTLEEPF